MRLTDANGLCGSGNPRFQFADAARIQVTPPAGYHTDPWYGTVMPTFHPLNASTLVGYRTVARDNDGFEGQMPMTVGVSLP
jgi:hypothetical protein